MAFSKIFTSLLILFFFLLRKAFSYTDNYIKPYEESYGSQEIPNDGYERNDDQLQQQYSKDDRNSYERNDRSYGSYAPSSGFPEDYNFNDINSDNYDPSYDNYGPSRDSDMHYSKNGNYAPRSGFPEDNLNDPNRDNYDPSYDNYGPTYDNDSPKRDDGQRYPKNEIGKTPKFLQLTTMSRQQIFMDLELEEGRPRTTIESQKMSWAKRNGGQIESVYKQFKGDVKAAKERFLQNRKQNLVGLSRQARDLDRKIQVIVTDQSLSRSQCLIRINSLLAGSNDRTRKELREKVRVIGPLDGNFPPINRQKM
ncbi:hypothetical protein niasHT_012509 [Heterodera trifolii]|uniref:SXP/RAL-2 family protein Ani s 5-like cation-binding domain-containing protein n=1 Tax=Heterodera trifolii TaxID=157864 RepID=A0ABD2LCJ1_9BILA